MFTGDEFADGGELIADVLRRHNVKASFFLTGNFYKTPAFKAVIRGLKKEGHYLGAHSDKHLLYADWTKRDSLLVSKKQFLNDLKKNYQRMETFGIKKTNAGYFLPPYEWYNSSISNWAAGWGIQLVNFSPGTLSAADYTFPGMRGYKSSDEIYNSIINHEEQDPNGLNGFILLAHIGTDERRTDKFYRKLDPLLHALKAKGYSFVRIDQLLN